MLRILINKITFCGTRYLSHCHTLRYVMYSEEEASKTFAPFVVFVIRVRSASNVTVITRNLPRKLRVGKIENYP